MFLEVDAHTDQRSSQCKLASADGSALPVFHMLPCKVGEIPGQTFAYKLLQEPVGLLGLS